MRVSKNRELSQSQVKSQHETQRVAILEELKNYSDPVAMPVICNALKHDHDYYDILCMVWGLLADYKLVLTEDLKIRLPRENEQFVSGID